MKDSKNQQTFFPLPKPTTFKEACSDLPKIASGEGDKIFEYNVHASSDYQKLMRGEISLKEFFNWKHRFNILWEEEEKDAVFWD